MIQIKKSVNSDSRSCDFSKVTKEQLKTATEQHIEDVSKATRMLCGGLICRANIHDWDKLVNIDYFYNDFKTGFKVHDWWDSHKVIQKHHLNVDCEQYNDINLLDVLEHISDCVMAGLARTGTVFPIEINNDLLQLAVKNTVDMLIKNTEVVD